MTQEEFDNDYFDDDDDEGLCEQCPKCGRSYDDIDFDFQCCSKCGWDEAQQKWTKPREPNEDDYLNGDADYATGRFY